LRSAVNKSTQSKGRGRVEACPFAGIIQIKFNGNFSERIMPKQSSNTRHAYTNTYDDQSAPSQVSKKSNLLDRTPFSINIQCTLLPRWSLRLESGGGDYLLVPDSVVTPLSASRTSSSVDWEASLRSIRLWNQTALDLRHHSSTPMAVMPDMITIA
jgi:hypothetical protein